MINRGLHYYNITDIKKNTFRTVDAKQLENAIMEEEIDLTRETYLSEFVSEATTRHLDLFTGNLLIQFVPKEIIRIFFQYKEFKKISENPLTSTETIRDKTTSLETELLDYKTDQFGDPLDINSFIVIYQLQDDGKKQLDSVGTGIPRHIMRYLSDERVYHLDNDKAYVSDEGVPEGLHYYLDKNLKVKYTCNLDRGRQVGT